MIQTARTVTLALLLSALGGCAGAAPEAARPAPAPESAPRVAEAAEAVEAGPVQMARAWTHGTMNLRAGPTTRDAVVGQVPAGAELWIGRPNREGWARVYDPQQFSMEAVSSRGWIYTKSRLLKSRPPAGRKGRS